MSKPIVNIANLDNKSAAEAIIDYAGDFFASITLEDIPNILKDIIDNLKSVGKQVIDKITDFILNDFWGLVIDTKDIIKSLLNQHLDKALNCASRALDKLEKVLDVLSYIPCLSVAIGIILIVVYICQLDFAAIASAAICMLGPLKIITKIFPKSKNIINKLMDFLVDFGKRFKDQAKTSLKALFRKSKVSSTIETPKQNYSYDNNHTLLKITQKKEIPQSIDTTPITPKTDIVKQQHNQILESQQVIKKDGINGSQTSYEISTKAYLYSHYGAGVYSKTSSNVNKVIKTNSPKVESLDKTNNKTAKIVTSNSSTKEVSNAGRIIGYGSPDYKYNDRILGQGSILNRNRISIAEEQMIEYSQMSKYLPNHLTVME